MLPSRNDKDQLVFTFERELDPDTANRLVKYARFLELTAGAKKASQKTIMDLSEKTKASW